MVLTMRNVKAIVIALLLSVLLAPALAMPAEAFDGSGGAWGESYRSYPGTSWGLYPGQPWGGWNPPGWPQDNWYWWNRPGWGDGYPGPGSGWGSWFSNCYTRCMASGYGSTYCSRVCPV